MAIKGPWFTKEDAMMSFNLFCCVYGVGTLGMPGNFSRAGPALAIVAMLFMAAANIYASVVCSKVMLLAPRSVKTFGDLGEWCMGKTGRWLIVISHTAVCLSIPMWYLVSGGNFLPALFPDTFSQTTWIILMAVSLLPVCLVPTLKEGAGMAFAGCLGTILADVIGIGLLLHGMSGHPSAPKPDISFEQVAQTFGNLSLAYAAGIVIPALQRQHTQPERMPRVIWVTLLIISVFFITLASSGYTAVGCQIAGNLLFSIFPNSDTGLAKLGFYPDKGLAVLAYLFIQLHITIAFAVILNPALYVFERTLLGMHKRKDEGDLEAVDYTSVTTPGKDELRNSKVSGVSLMEAVMENDEADESQNYKGYAHKYIPLRIVIIAIMTACAIGLKDHFGDLADLIGASAVSLSCLIMPVLFWFSKSWNKIPMYEKVYGSIVVVICTVFGCYVTYTSGKSLFSAVDPDAATFPFCEPEWEFDLYYNASAVNSS
jgi:vesicular inhibitory amino acid transporter